MRGKKAQDSEDHYHEEISKFFDTSQIAAKYKVSFPYYLTPIGILDGCRIVISGRGRRPVEAKDYQVSDEGLIVFLKGSIKNIAKTILFCRSRREWRLKIEKC